jgi:methylthioribose-1-phosphate isomerase
MNTDSYDNIRAIEWRDDCLYLLDQRLLPHTEKYIALSDVVAVAKAITDMVVRGAPAIGVTAAYGVVIAVRSRYQQEGDNWHASIEQDLHCLAASRPTAVNLFWAIDRMRKAMETLPEGDPTAVLLTEAIAVHKEDIAANHHMGELGAGLISPSSGVLTHCNTGSLATGGYGTALGVIRSAYRAGKLSCVYADETRPWLQGARLTAWELVQDNIPVTLQADGAASHLMKQGGVHWVIVGSDRIAGNGDVANKIGTYHLAVAARYHGVKFMVVAPTSTIDMQLSCGDEIPIENRPQEEVLSLGGQRIAPAGVSAWNPSFDVTPAALVDAIVTEKGVVHSPNAAKMRELMSSAG